MTGTRRQSRELALQVLFQGEFVAPGDLSANLQHFKEHFAATDEVWNYTLNLVIGVRDHKNAIDGLIETHSAHWSLPRMAMVDRNVMRIAVFETKFSAEPIPPAVAINEAIEIARKFGTNDSPSFVNGILDQIVKQ